MTAATDPEVLRGQGWRQLPTIRYSRDLGRTFMRTFEGTLQIGLIAGENLGNDNFGIVHGGAIMTFGDIALGCAVAHGSDALHFVTAQIQVQFVSAARVGSFLVCEPEVVRRTSQLVFVRGLVAAEGRTVASLDGIFKLLDRDKVASLKAG